MLENTKQNWNKKLRHLKHKHLILKIKWALLFVLPILIIVFAYQVIKQYLKLRISRFCAQKPEGMVQAGKNGLETPELKGNAR